MERIELSLGEADTFSTSGVLRKALRTIPEGVFVGADVAVGHWHAEVTSIEHRENELERKFFIGLRMKF